MNNFKKKSLYVHIPFCKQKCLYCDFPSYSGQEYLMNLYIKALNKELEKFSKTDINTVFIGGGTPTYLTLEDLEVLKQGIRKLNISKESEFTMECNPGTIDRKKLKVIREMGVNRLSFGLQAWQNTLLKKLGRIHTKEVFLESFNLAREEGFQNINIDLMFGLPDQSLQQWKETIKQVINLNPEHIACYGLIVEEGTVFCKMFEKKQLELPKEEVEREMYSYAVEELKRNGYTQYEISNFSKTNRESKHNLVYWELEEYIGCGAAAHSYFNNLRYKNIEHIKDYIQDIDQQLFTKLEKHENSLEDTISEFMFMGLRKTKGISIKEFQKRFNKDIFELYGEVIENFIKKELLIIDGDRIYLTFRGIEISNSVMCEFIITTS